MTELESMVGKNEHVFWKGNPDKKCFILESIFNPLLPLAILWLLFDAFFLSKALGTGDSGVRYFIICFMVLHLMPVWLYLGGVIFSVRKYRRTGYIVTDKGVYISGGLFSYSNRMKPFAELSNIEIHRGVFDQMLGVGDVIITTSGGPMTSSSIVTARSVDSVAMSGNLVLKDLSDYQDVCSLIKQLQTDIFSDTMYPNDLRPESNHGYRTKYYPDDDLDR